MTSPKKERFHPAVQWGIERALQSGHRPPIVKTRRSGAQANVVIIGDATGPRWVLKMFDPGHADSAEAVAAEFDALRAFHNRLAREPDSYIGCPKPLDVNHDLFSYLMTHVRGKTLPQSLPADRESLADRLVQGLRLYYEATGQAFGDFHPDNAMNSEARLILFDPTMTDPYFDDVVQTVGGAAPADVGYWTYWLGSRSLRRLVTDPVAMVRLRALTLQVLIVAARQFMPNSMEDFIDAAELAARRHAMRLRSLGGAKNDILSRYTIRYARSICGEARRRLAA